MAAGWTWPLLTSVLRLIFISTLMVVNWAALYRLTSSKKRKAGQRQEKLLVTTIIVVSLVYLTVVWAPFTFSALKHDLSDLQLTQYPKVDFESNNLDLESNFLFPKTLDLKGDTLVNFAEGKPKKEDQNTVDYIDHPPSLESIFQDVVDGDDNFEVEYVDLAGDPEDNLAENEVAQEFILEYVDIATGETVKGDLSKAPKAKRSADSEEEEEEEKDIEATWTVFFHSQPNFQPDDFLSRAGVWSSFGHEGGNDEGRSHALSSSWDSYVQDFVTSSCVYSIACIAMIRVVLLRRMSSFPEGPLFLGIWYGLVVGIPAAITLLARTLATTTSHFAPHEPEYTSAGYFLYNIICDVHISQEYVISVFLEWGALFTLLMLMLLIVVYTLGLKANRGRRSITEEDEDLQDYETLHQEVPGGSISNSPVETWARDVVLAVAAIWSWPVKPVLVIILFGFYGPHWTNVVCWLAHVVVAIPVVFIPLAVFLSRYHQEKSQMDIYVIDEDPRISDKYNKDDEKGHGLTFNQEKVQNTDLSNNFDGGNDSKGREGEIESIPGGHSDDEGQGHARENLKFYLGKDIFKYGLRAKEEDKQIILDNEWGETSISEA